MIAWFRSHHTLKRLALALVAGIIVSLVVWVMVTIPTCSDKALERAGEEVMSQGLDPSDPDNHERMYSLYVGYLDECVTNKEESFRW